MKVRISICLLVSVSLWFSACGSGGSGTEGGVSSGGGGTNPTGSPVYVTNSTVGSVSAYLLDPTSGALQKTSGSPVSTGASSPDSLAVDANKKFVLVANAASASISSFTLNSSTAALTPVAGSPFPTGSSVIRLVIHPNGKFVYALSSTPAQILGFSLDTATGALSPLSGFPVSLNTTGEMGLAISPNGSFLYTSNPNTRLITSFSITSTGTLASLGTTLAPNSAPAFLTFDAVGNFLFAINTAGGLAGNGSVSEFTVSATGTLAEQPGSPFTVGATPVNAAFANGVLYVVNQTSGSVSALALNTTTGALADIKGSPYAVGSRPVSVAPASRGNFLVVTSSASSTGGLIFVFSVAPDGTLTSVTGSPFTPDAAVPDQVLAL